MIIYQKIGKRIKVVDMHTIKPIDRKAIIESASTGNIIVAQDHNVIGGLGQQVASIIAEEGLQVRFKNIGIRDEFTAMAHAPYLYHKYGYDKEGLVNTLLEFLDN